MNRRAIQFVILTLLLLSGFITGDEYDDEEGIPSTASESSDGDSRDSDNGDNSDFGSYQESNEFSESADGGDSYVTEKTTYLIIRKPLDPPVEENFAPVPSTNPQHIPFPVQPGNQQIEQGIEQYRGQVEQSFEPPPLPGQQSNPVQAPPGLPPQLQQPQGQQPHHHLPHAPEPQQMIPSDLQGFSPPVHPPTAHVNPPTIPHGSPPQQPPPGHQPLQQVSPLATPPQHVPHPQVPQPHAPSTVPVVTVREVPVSQAGDPYHLREGSLAAEARAHDQAMSYVQPSPHNSRQAAHNGPPPPVQGVPVDVANGAQSVPQAVPQYVPPTQPQGDPLNVPNVPQNVYSVPQNIGNVPQNVQRNPNYNPNPYLQQPSAVPPPVYNNNMPPSPSGPPPAQVPQQTPQPYAYSGVPQNYQPSIPQYNGPHGMSNPNAGGNPNVNPNAGASLPPAPNMQKYVPPPPPGAHVPAGTTFG